MSFEDLLARCDFVIATCSVSEENRHLFNGEAFALMKPSAILINVTRGALVDQDALLKVIVIVVVVVIIVIVVIIILINVLLFF